MNLAKTRVLQVLPQRLQEWALAPSAAEDKNRKGKDIILYNFNKERKNTGKREESNYF